MFPEDFMADVEVSAQQRREAAAYAWGVACYKVRHETIGGGLTGGAFSVYALIRSEADAHVAALELDAEGEEGAARVREAYGCGYWGDPFGLR